MSPIIFFLCCLCFWCLIYGNPWPNLRSQRFTLVFYSENFIVLAVTFRSLVDFELIFLYMAWDRQPSHFTSPPAVNKNFSFSTSLPKLTIIFLIVFDLPFANDQCCWAFFHVPIGHLCICSGEKSIQVLWPFFSCIVNFFVAVQLWGFFMYFRYQSLSDTWFANISSRCVGCLSLC